MCFQKKIPLINKFKPMKPLLTILIILISGSIYSQPKPATSTTDFEKSTGSWRGTITYLDYTSGKPFSMPANVSLRIANNSQIILSYAYPNEPNANGKDTLLISGNGSLIDGAEVQSREILEDGAVKIVTVKAGRDGNDNKSALIRHSYILGKNSFQNVKEVKFAGTDKWIVRNTYLYSR